MAPAATTEAAGGAVRAAVAVTGALRLLGDALGPRLIARRGPAALEGSVGLFGALFLVYLGAVAGVLRAPDAATGRA